MNSKEYWAKREAEQLKHNITEEAEYDKEIQRIYSNMLDACNKEINAFYGKYVSKEGITLAEAKKRVSTLDIKEYERKAQRYVKDAALDRKANGGKTNKSGYYFSAKAEEEMRLYNTTMKINRLEMLKANIGIELIKGHDELDKFMGDILKGRTMAELERQAGILGKTVRNNAKTAHAIVNGSFHSGTFSDRIWQYQDIMREDLGKLLQTALIRGKNPRVLAGELKKYWYGNDPKTGGGAKYCMERLMRTELARVQTEAQKQSFERNGFTEYEFIANGDCCDICKDLDGDIFKVAKMMPGENAPPMHPHCRCSTAAHSDRKEYEEWLDYLSKGGTTEEYNKQKSVSSMMQAQDIKITNKQMKNAYLVNRMLVNSKEYHDKFESLPLSKNTQQSAYYESKVILEHRDGTYFEDVTAIDSKTGKFIVTNNTYEKPFKSAMTKEEYSKVTNHEGKVVIIHNHAEGTRLSKTDIFTAFATENADVSIAIGHNGSVHYIYDINREIDIDKIYKEVYNYSLEEYGNKDLATKKATDALYKSGAFKYVVL